MKKWALLMLISLFGVAFGFTDMSDVHTESGEFTKFAAAGQLEPISHDLTIFRIAAALEDTARPVFAPFLGGDVMHLGITYYEMQHNTTLGRNIALDDYGNAHMAWTHAPNPLLSSRNIRYNFVAADADAPQFPEGLRSDAAIFRSGFCNIDAIGCTPYIVYHQSHSSTAPLHSQLSWDAASVETECMIHGGFSPADPSPPTVAYPECPEDRADIVDIWPKISISEFTTDVHMVATTSNNDSLFCGGDHIQPKNYFSYYHGTIDPVDGSVSFTKGIVLAESRGVSPDVATARTRNEVAVAYAYMGDYECNWPDSNNIILLRSNDNGETWDTTAVTNYGPDYRYDDYDTHFYGGLYITEIDSSETPYDTTIAWLVDTVVIYSRPSGGLNVMYDAEDYIHVTWTEGSYAANDSCTGNTVSSYYRSNLVHWTDRYPDQYNRPLSSYPSLTPGAGGDPASNPRLFFSSYNPTVSVDLNDNTLYCIWHQYHGEIWWMRYIPGDVDDIGMIYYDRSSGGYANNELFISYSEDNGQTWKGPLSLSNTYTPFCEPGDCQSELDASIASVANDFIHVFYIEDRDAGISIHEQGEFVSCPAKYARVPVSRVKAAADAVDRVSYVLTMEWPDSSIGHGLERDVINTLERDFPGIMNEDYLEAVEEPKFIDKPETFDMAMNFPNPFNAITLISYEINKADHYIIEVYDMSGTLVSVLANTYKNPGKYNVTWEGVDMLGNPLESGTYIYRIRDSKGHAIARKMTLVK